MRRRNHPFAPQSSTISTGGEAEAAEKPSARDRSGRPGGMHRMTCQELRLYLEDPLRSDAKFRVETEHLVHCVECARFVEAQRQLGSGLGRLREAVPQFPLRLDATVIANYRRDGTNRPRVRKPSAARRRIAILCMSGAAAATVLVAVLIFFVRPRGSSPISGPHRPESAAASQSIAGNLPPNFSAPAKIGNSHPAKGRRSALPVVAPEISLSPDFR